MKPARLPFPVLVATTLPVLLFAWPALAAPVATAPDGEARGYERPPSSPDHPAGTVLRGAGKGASYLVRALIFPLRGAAKIESRWQVSRRVHELFWNQADTVGLVPVASYSISNGPQVGVRGVVKDVFGHDEQLAIAATTGGIVEQAYQLRFTAPRLTPAVSLGGRVAYQEHDGLRFHGIGNDGPLVESRFAQERLLAVLEADVTGGKFLRVGTSAIFDDRSFAGAGAGGGASITDVYDTSTIPGFDDGSRNLELTADVTLDGRDTPGPTSAGGVARVFAGAGDLTDQPYAHYGAELAYHVTPFWPGRVVGARVALEGVLELDGDVAFTDLPRLGGAPRLRGYTAGQYRDRLATVATLEYRYPVHANVSGELFVEAGKVAHTYDQLAGDGVTEAWHTSVGGGLVVHTPSSIALRVDVAYGDGLQLFLGTDVLDAFRDREHEL